MRFRTRARYLVLVPVLLLLTVAVAAAIFARSASAITNGTLDGNRHPNVGALLAEWRTPGVKEELCTGTLISPTVFLTASHCTAYLESLGIPTNQIWVSFDQDVDPVTSATTLYQGHWVTNPGFNHRQSDPGDIAVVLFDTPIQGVSPAALPPAGLFDHMKADGTLKDQQYTAVGYGDRERQNGGGQPFFLFDGQRYRAVSSFNSLQDAWLRLSQNPAHGDGGTCFGDSGGPNFLGAGSSETNVIAAITITGDSACVSTNVDYRLDSAPARAFLSLYVVLP
jgi:hypothetical protein